MPEDFEEILVPRVQIVQTMRNVAHAFHTEMGAVCMHKFFEVQFSDFVDPRCGVAVLPSCAHAICDAESDPHGSEVWEGDSCFPGAVFQQGRTDRAGSTGAGCRIYSRPLHVVTQRQIPMAQKIGKAMKFFLDAVYRQAVDVLFMQAVQVPQEKFLHVWNERGVVHCVCCRRKERSG